MPETSKKGWIDSNLFNVNRNKWTFEQLAPYAGQHVAWSADGTRIVAQHADLPGLFQAVLEMGLSTEEVVFSYIPGLDEPDSLI